MPNIKAFKRYPASVETRYWAGFMGADAWVHGDRVELELAEKDRDHVRKWAEFIGANYDETRERARAAVSSSELVHALEPFGIHQRKSQVYEAPWWLECDPHFWRGYVDGDGWIRSGERPGVGVCGTETIVKQFVKFCTFITHRTDGGPKIHSRGLNYAEVEFRRKKEVLAILETLYYPRVKPVLKRKLELARKTIKQVKGK